MLRGLRLGEKLTSKEMTSLCGSAGRGARITFVVAARSWARKLMFRSGLPPIFPKDFRQNRCSQNKPVNICFHLWAFFGDVPGLVHCRNTLVHRYSNCMKLNASLFLLISMLFSCLQALHLLM